MEVTKNSLNDQPDHSEKNTRKNDEAKFNADEHAKNAEAIDRKEHAHAQFEEEEDPIESYGL